MPKKVENIKKRYESSISDQANDYYFESLMTQMNFSQKKIFQRHLEIIPEMDEFEKDIIKELIASHIVGINEDERIIRFLSMLGINEG